MDSTPKTVADIIAELQALDTTALDAVVAGVAQAVTDLQALPATSVASPAPTVLNSNSLTPGDSTSGIGTANTNR